jgi:hypothetical protein
MPMTTVDRVGPRLPLSLAKWEDRLSLPRDREPSLRRSVSMRNGMRDPEGAGGHKRNHSDSLLQGLPAIQSGVPQELGGRMSYTYLAHRPAPPIPGHGQGHGNDLRPTTRRSRTPVQYTIGNQKPELDRLSTLSRQTSVDSLKRESLRRGRSGSVREIVSNPNSNPNLNHSPGTEIETKPMGTWERVREGASATVRSRRGSFASIWSTSHLIPEVETIKLDGDAMTRIADLDIGVEEDVDDLRTHNEEDDLEETEVFIGFDDL